VSVFLISSHSYFSLSICHLDGCLLPATLLTNCQSFGKWSFSTIPFYFPRGFCNAPSFHTPAARGATGCGLFADIRIQIRLQSGSGYHFFTSVNIRIRIYIQKLGADMDMIKAISYSYPIQYPNVGCLIMISI